MLRQSLGQLAEDERPAVQCAKAADDDECSHPAAVAAAEESAEQIRKRCIGGDELGLRDEQHGNDGNTYIDERDEHRARERRTRNGARRIANSVGRNHRAFDAEHGK